MKALDHRILVKVDMSQKDFSSGLRTAKEYDVNYRNRRPVLCECLQNNGILLKGDNLLVHHNLFYEDSPYWVEDGIFSLILGKNIFSRLDKDGNPHSIFGNIMAERIPLPSIFEMPPEKQKMHKDRVRVICDGEGYRKGVVILCLEYADYEIIYNWKGEERRVIKVYKEDIFGKLFKKV